MKLFVSESMGFVLWAELVAPSLRSVGYRDFASYCIGVVFLLCAHQKDSYSFHSHQKKRKKRQIYLQTLYAVTLHHTIAILVSLLSKNYSIFTLYINGHTLVIILFTDSIFIKYHIDGQGRVTCPYLIFRNIEVHICSKFLTGGALTFLKYDETYMSESFPLLKNISD